MNVEHRLAKLEKQNRWLRGAVCCLCAWCGLSVFLGAASDQDDLVRAGQFQLIGDNGSIIGVWGASDGGGSSLVMFPESDDDHHRGPSFSVAVNKETAHLRTSFDNDTRWIAGGTKKRGNSRLYVNGKLHDVIVTD